jgi:hypothetical protein
LLGKIVPIDQQTIHLLTRVVVAVHEAAVNNQCEAGRYLYQQRAGLEARLV